MISENIKSEKLKQNQIILIVIVILLIIITISSILIIRRNKEIRKLNNELSIKNNELQESNNSLHDSNLAKNVLFSIIAHDLKNGIGGVSSLLKVISSEFDIFSKEEIKEMINDISHSYSNVEKLLDNLLLWSSLIKGKFTPNFDFNYPHMIAKNSIELYEPKIKEKNIKVENLIPDSLYICLDSSMFDTIIRNLLNNAIKYTNENGLIKIIYREETNFHRFEVIDNGVGMTQETIQKIMNNTVISKIGTKGEKGTGLGLMICSEFIKLHNGKFWYESKLNFGSSAIFTFSKDLIPSKENVLIENNKEINA